MLDKILYITIDVDWAIDPVLDYSLQLFKELDIKTTINITHETSLIPEMKKKHELGIHPNFNVLLSSCDQEMDYLGIIEKTKSIIPDAITVRSHSCVSGSQIRYALSNRGIKYELNDIIIPEKGQRIYPWKLFDLWQIPYIFEDDLYFSDENKKNRGYWFERNYDMYRILNFHPIHIFLNTEGIDRYNKARPYLKNFEKLCLFRNNSMYGTEDLLRDVVEEGRKKGYRFETISNIGIELGERL